jgi:hypothetical protein
VIVLARYKLWQEQGRPAAAFVLRGPKQKGTAALRDLVDNASRSETDHWAQKVFGTTEDNEDGERRGRLGEVVQVRELREGYEVTIEPRLLSPENLRLEWLEAGGRRSCQSEELWRLLDRLGDPWKRDDEEAATGAGQASADENRKLAEKIGEEARAHPQSPYAGKFVGIAHGRVVVIADNWDQLARQLRQIEPDPSKTFSIEASRDYSQVHEIWELR